VDSTAYPAVLFLTGANDPRVNPMHSRKMTARLQAATSSGLHVLLRTSSTSGHINASLNERVERSADIYAFLLHELGVSIKP
jgi:prolyl oligopeptidase